MSLKQTVAPVQAPVTLEEAKEHLHVIGDDEDTLIAGMIESTRLHLEGRYGWLGRALLTQTWEWRFDRFPRGSPMILRLPLPPVQSITSIQYIDTAGASQTWSASLYTTDFDSEPARVTPVFGEFFPQTQAVIDAVTVTLVAGFGAAPVTVPSPIRSAMKLIIGDLYKNRESRLRSGEVDNPTAAALLMPYRTAAF